MSVVGEVLPVYAELGYVPDQTTGEREGHIEAKVICADGKHRYLVVRSIMVELSEYPEISGFVKTHEVNFPKWLKYMKFQERFPTNPDRAPQIREIEKE